MTRNAVATAERLVRQRFPDARAAWLGGSGATNTMKATSDLDITVLLRADPAPFRESLTVRGQPIELFVHTEESLQFFCEQDRRRRRPTLLRLIGSSIVLIDADGAGRRLQDQFHRMDREGSTPLSAEEIDAARYVITDLLDDLSGSGPDSVVIAAALWREAADLLLGGNGRWSGSGKWLLREIQALDADRGTDHSGALLNALTEVSRGDLLPMQRAVDAVLAQFGGRLFDGYHRSGTGSTAFTGPLVQPWLEGE